MCSVYPKQSVFSNATPSCNHTTLGLPIDTPKLLREKDYTYNVRPTEHLYLQYSKPEAQKILDMRYVEHDKASIFPRDIYSKEPLAGSIENNPRYSNIKNRPIDSNIRYTKTSKTVHPDHFSRFGYDIFPNEYGVGEQSRGYVDPQGCSDCDVPTGMAPEEFYKYGNFNLSEYRVSLDNYHRRL